MAHIRLSTILLSNGDYLYSALVRSQLMLPSRHHTTCGIATSKLLRENLSEITIREASNQRIECTLVLAPATENQQFGAAHTPWPLTNAPRLEVDAHPYPCLLGASRPSGWSTKHRWETRLRRWTSDVPSRGHLPRHERGMETREMWRWAGVTTRTRALRPDFFLPPNVCFPCAPTSASMPLKRCHFCSDGMALWRMRPKSEPPAARSSFERAPFVLCCVDLVLANFALHLFNETDNGLFVPSQSVG